ncbi:MAG: polysaccharide deacetylase family protein [Xenococcaceae cyanobacterium]
MSKTVLASRISKKIGANRLLSPIYAGIGAIFMLHRVSDGESELDDRLFTSSSFLDRYLSYLKKKNIDIVSSNEALKRIQSNSNKYFVCFSFDDGYRDNLTKAFPVFVKHQVPFSINVTKDMVERKLFYWWRGIESIFQENDELSFVYQDNQYNFLNHTYQQKKQNYLNFIQEIQTKQLDLEEKINPLLEKYSIDIQKSLEEEALSEKDLKELSSSHLVTLGSHGVTHRNLKTLTEAEVRHEMEESKSFLEAITGKTVSHFAYPFGAAGHRELRIAQLVGFSTATTIRNGTLKKAHRNHLHSLPRLSLHRKFELISWMEFQRIGMFSQISRRTLKPVFII